MIWVWLPVSFAGILVASAGSGGLLKRWGARWICYGGVPSDVMYMLWDSHEFPQGQLVKEKTSLAPDSLWLPVLSCKVFGLHGSLTWYRLPWWDVVGKTLWELSCCNDLGSFNLWANKTLYLWSAQTPIFCYSNRKWTNTVSNLDNFQNSPIISMCVYTWNEFQKAYVRFKFLKESKKKYAIREWKGRSIFTVYNLRYL